MRDFIKVLAKATIGIFIFTVVIGVAFSYIGHLDTARFITTIIVEVACFIGEAKLYERFD